MAIEFLKFTDGRLKHYLVKFSTNKIMVISRL